MILAYTTDMDTERKGLTGNALLFKIARDRGYVTEDDLYRVFPFAKEDIDAFELAMDTIKIEKIVFVRADVTSVKPLAI